MKKVILAVGTLLLYGCASTGVVPMGADTFMIAKGGVRPQTPGDLLASIVKEANAYCLADKKKMVPISTNMVPGGLLVEPDAMLQFKCADE